MARDAETLRSEYRLLVEELAPFYGGEMPALREATIYAERHIVRWQTGELNPPSSVMRELRELRLLCVEAQRRRPSWSARKVGKWAAPAMRGMASPTAERNRSRAAEQMLRCLPAR